MYLILCRILLTLRSLDHSQWKMVGNDDDDSSGKWRSVFLKKKKEKKKFMILYTFMLDYKWKKERDLDKTWDSNSLCLINIGHREWKGRQTSPAVVGVKPQRVWDKLVLAVMWERVKCCTTDKDVCRGCLDMIAIPVDYIISINDSLSLTLCSLQRPLKSQNIGFVWVSLSWFGIISRLLLSAVWHQQHESLWSFSRGKLAWISQLLQLFNKYLFF